MSGEAIPCPFCGDSDIQTFSELSWGTWTVYLYCLDCHAEGPHAIRRDENEAWSEAIEAWNKRRETR